MARGTSLEAARRRLFCGPGALVCSIVAGLVLGTVGAFGGRAMAESLYDEAHRPRDPREYPGHSVVCPGCHDNPATHADRFRVLSPGQPDLRPPPAPTSRELSAADRAVIMRWLRSRPPGRGERAQNCSTLHYAAPCRDRGRLRRWPVPRSPGPGPQAWCRRGTGQRA